MIAKIEGGSAYLPARCKKAWFIWKGQIEGHFRKALSSWAPSRVRAYAGVGMAGADGRRASRVRTDAGLPACGLDMDVAYVVYYMYSEERLRLGFASKY